MEPRRHKVGQPITPEEFDELTDEQLVRLVPRQYRELLEAVPGVGPRTAEAIVAHRHEPGRFGSGKRVSAYAGLVPRQYRQFFPGKDFCADGFFYLHDGTAWSFFKGGFLDE